MQTSEGISGGHARESLALDGIRTLEPGLCTQKMENTNKKPNVPKT